MRTWFLPLVLLATLRSIAQTEPNDGPDAPDVAISYESGSGFFFILSNPSGSNNYLQQYAEAVIPAETSPDPFWRFQGYVLFQFVDEEAASDSLLYRIRDVTKARPVLGVDLDDTISVLVDTYDPSGPGTCGQHQWYLANSSVSSSFSAFFDPFTMAPYVDGNSYCFLVLAFGADPFHMDPDCQQPDGLIFGKHSASHELQTHCVVAGPIAGITEVDPDAVFTASPNPSVGRVQVRFSGGARTLRWMDARGATCGIRTVTSGESVDLGGARGVYELLLTTSDGRTAHQRVVVE